jgi:hypothetical protein
MTDIRKWLSEHLLALTFRIAPAGYREPLAEACRAMWGKGGSRNK